MVTLTTSSKDSLIWSLKMVLIAEDLAQSEELQSKQVSSRLKDNQQTTISIQHHNHLKILRR